MASAGRLGAAAIEPPVTLGTFFDLASLTKPLTALAAARLARTGKLDFSASLATWLPEVQDTCSADVPLELFFAHRSGVSAYGALYRHLAQGRLLAQKTLLIEAASARRADAAGALPSSGFEPVYSDLGYLLAGEAVARAGGQALDAVIEETVVRPLACDLGSARRLASRDAGFRRRVAATELVPWRGGVLRGVVHDENAWAYAGEGVAGHAGLFGTVGGVVRLGVAIVDAIHGRLDGFLTAAEIGRLVERRAGGTLRAGFDGKSEEGSSAGRKFGPSTVGHLGFTGTSIWCDPERQWVGVLLTNRVHPTRHREAIRVARPRAYDEIAGWCAALRVTD
jgi:CubicO group peptidase (beta-lactamase class C family)